MTVAVKRVNGRPASAILTVANKKVGDRARGCDAAQRSLAAGLIVSPSVNRFLSVTTLGVRDFRLLAELMAKPANSVMMSFAADPNPGLTHDHFSGSAIVFVSHR